MDQYCRLCLKEDFKDVFISFSHILSDSSSVLDSYKLLTYINFEDQEDLDNSKICEECCFKLSSFNDFRSLAINNNDYIINLKLQGSDVFEELLKKNTVKTEEYDLLSDIKTELFELPVICNAEEFEQPNGADEQLIKEEIIEEKTRKSKRTSKQPKKIITESPKKTPKTKKNLTKAKTSIHKRISIKPIKSQAIKKPKNAETSLQDLHKLNTKKQGTEMIICNYCGKTVQRQSMHKHIRRKHLKVYPWICDYCGSKFMDLYELRCHIFRHVKLCQYECKICHKKFVAPTYLNKHVREEHLKKKVNSSKLPISLPCPYRDCTFKTTREINVKMHIDRMHLKLRKFVCECGKPFSDKTYYIEHRASHSDVRNFECPVCKERFKTKVSMGIHRKRQHEKPRFPCKLCDKGFHNPSNLNDHIHSVHDRSRDFQCQHCDKNYAIKKYLLDHIKEIHFKSKISCELCKTKLARVINYKMHVKRVHKDLSEDEMTALLLRIKKIRPDYENMEFYYS